DASKDLKIIKSLTMSYYETGQVSGYIDVTNEKGTAENNDKLDLTTTSVRNNTAYNTINQLTDYTDKITNNADSSVVIKNIKENQDGTTTMDYDSLGRLIAYTELISQSDLETVSARTDTSYDDLLGQADGYKDTIKTNISVVVTVREVGKQVDAVSRNIVSADAIEAIKYDIKGRMAEYVEKVTESGRLYNGDTLNNVIINRRQVWSDDSDVNNDGIYEAGYNSLGQMIAYTDISVSPSASRDLITQKDVTGSRFDEKGRIVYFEQDIIEADKSFAAQVALRSDASLITGTSKQYVRTKQAHIIALFEIDPVSGLYNYNPDGVPVIAGSGYNVLGQIISSADIINSSATPDMQSVRLQGNIDYDDYGRTTAFTEINVNYDKRYAANPEAGALFTYSILNREVNGFNNLGQITDYTDTIDGVTLRIVTGARYNSAGQIKYYKERTVESEKDVIERIKLDAGYKPVAGVHFVDVDSVRFMGKFEGITDGVVQGEALSLDSDLTQIAINNETGYDDLGRMKYYAEISINRSASKELISVKAMESISYNKQALTAGFEQIIVEQDVNWPFGVSLVASAPDKIARARELISESLSSEETQDNYKGAEGLLRLADDVGAAGHDMWVALQQEYRIALDWTDSAPALHHVVTNTARNALATVYNGYGLLKEYEDRSVNISASPDLVTSVEMNIIRFNKQGRAEEYIETKADRDKLVQEAIDTGASVEALEAQYDNELLNIVTTTHRNNIFYIKFGLVESYDEITNSTATPNLKIERRMSDIGYNESAQQKEYKEAVTEEDEFDPVRRFVQTNTARDDMEYNRLGLLRSYANTDYIHRLDAPDLLIARHVTDRIYDGNGLLIGYHQVDNEYFYDFATGAGYLTDPYGEYQDENSINQGNIADISLYHATIITDRLAGKYDATGLIESYVDVIVNENISPDLTTTSIVTNTKYWDSGLRKSYDELKREQKLDTPGNVTIDPVTGNVLYTIDATDIFALDLATNIIRTNMTYDNYGQLGWLLVSYQEVQTSTQATGLTTTSIWGVSGGALAPGTDFDIIWGIDSGQTAYDAGTRYDSLGRIRISIEDSTREIVNSDYAYDNINTLTTKHVKEYDSLGRVTEYEEWVKSGSTGEMLTYRHVINMKYNNKGQLIHQEEIITDRDRNNVGLYSVTTNVVRDVGEYALQLDGSVQHDVNGEPLGFISAGYNELGQMIRYTDSILSSRAPDLTENKTITAQYNALGQQRAVQESSIEVEAGWTFGSTTHHYVKTIRTRGGNILNGLIQGSIVYDTVSGKVIQYAESVKRQGDNLDQTTLTARSDIHYDADGNMYYYKDQIYQDFAQDLKTAVYFGDDDANGLDSTEKAVYAFNNLNPARLAGSVVYNALGLMIKSTEYKIETDIPTAGSTLNISTLTKKDPIQYNSLGQIAGYTEDAFRAGQSAQRTMRSLTEYDSLGQMKWYQDVITNLAGAVALTTAVKFGFDASAGINGWTAVKYDTTGKIIEYYENKKEEDKDFSTDLNNDGLTKDLEVVSDNHRTTTYNNKGQVVG
ncbi:MAG: hypothetical protein COW10_02065, partial [Candidatus Omnitrophica bacterium CG12_big_fil_rev_8_21_14_0_65_42_8]